jgi:adenylate cyclase
MEDRTGIKRKLAAILNADVVGYSRLIRQDDESTVALLRRYRELMTESIVRHGGRVVDAPGDNLLAEFPSVVDAVRCAAEVQEAIAQANALLPPDRRMLFRMGINSGEVIQEGDRIYGNGVNVAARLQELAPAGGIAISESVYEEVGGRLSLTYEFLGEHLVKNIDRPLKVYAVGPRKAADERREPPEKGSMRRRKATWALVILGVLLLGASGLLFLYRSAFWPPEPAPAEVEPSPRSPGLSIAVLPFLDLSDAAQQERLGDGMAEDIITALAAMPRLSVVSRTSTFRYKGKVPDPRELGQELKVRYLLEGSVQKEGPRVRVTAQLIEAETGFHLWAERYDLETEDLFALRDDVTLRVVKALQAQLAEREGFSMKPRQTDSLEAYLRFLRGRSYASHFAREKNALARRSFQEAVSLDPGFLDAYLALAHTYITDWWLGWESSGEKALEQALEMTEKASQLKETNLNAQGLRSYVLTLRGERQKALDTANGLVATNPDEPESWGWLGVALFYSGQIQEAVPPLEKAVRATQSPAAWYLQHLGFAYLLSGRNDQAISAFEKALSRNERNPWALLGLAAAYGMAGQEEQARGAAARLRASHPGLSPELFASRLPFKDDSHRASFVNALRRAAGD